MHNEPPKKSIIYDVTNKLLDSVKEKGMKILFLVGDLATYKLLLELQIESVIMWFINVFWVLVYLVY